MAKTVFVFLCPKKIVHFILEESWRVASLGVTPCWALHRFFCPRVADGKRIAVRGTPVQAANVPKNAWRHRGTRWMFPKIRGFYPQNGWCKSVKCKTLFFNGWFGGTTIFGNTQMLFYEGKGPSQQTGKASVCVCVWVASGWPKAFL